MIVSPGSTELGVVWGLVGVSSFPVFPQERGKLDVSLRHSPGLRGGVGDVHRLLVLLRLLPLQRPLWILPRPVALQHIVHRLRPSSLFFHHRQWSLVVGRVQGLY